MNEVPGSFYIEHRFSWNRYNVELMDYSKELLKHNINLNTAFRLAKPSFFWYNFHFPLLRLIILVCTQQKAKRLCLPALSTLIISNMDS